MAATTVPRAQVVVEAVAPATPQREAKHLSLTVKKEAMMQLALQMVEQETADMDAARNRTARMTPSYSPAATAAKLEQRWNVPELRTMMSYASESTILMLHWWLSTEQGDMVTPRRRRGET